MWCNMFVMSIHGKLAAVIMSLWITTPKINPGNSMVINILLTPLFSDAENVCLHSAQDDMWLKIQHLTRHSLPYSCICTGWLCWLMPCFYMQRHYRLCIIEKKYYLFWKMVYVNPFPHYFLAKVRVISNWIKSFLCSRSVQKCFALRATYIKILGEVLWYTTPSMLVSYINKICLVF